MLQTKVKNYNMSNQLFDYFGIPIKFGSYVIVRSYDEDALKVVNIGLSTRAIRILNVRQPELVQMDRTNYCQTWLNIYNNKTNKQVFCRPPCDIIVIPDQQMTFHILRTGGDHNYVPLNNNQATDFFGTSIKVGSYVVCGSYDIRSMKFVLYSVNKIKVTKQSHILSLTLAYPIKQPTIQICSSQTIVMKDKHHIDYLKKLNIEI